MATRVVSGTIVVLAAMVLVQTSAVEIRTWTDDTGAFTVQAELIKVEADKVRLKIAADGKTALISFSDTGPGIPDKKREEVFQPFFSTKDEGFGLGLSIAARIIDEHGGRMCLETAQGNGATFIIFLPIRNRHHGSNTDRR